MFVILGPTSSGKSDYAIRLAKEVDGEIISVDSRQVYRGMDIGTGKVTRDPVSCHPKHPRPVIPSVVEGSPLSTADSSVRRLTRNDKHFFSEGIRHHLLDVASPKREYNVTHFLRDAKKAIADIERRGKTPILCGGTTFWTEALLLGTSFPEVKPDKKLREKLGKYSAEKLFKTLKEKDPERAASIDPKNKVRLIRALEIIASLGKVPPLPINPPETLRGAMWASSRQLTTNEETSFLCHPEQSEGSRTSSKQNEVLLLPWRDRNDIKIIILNPPKEILHARIEKRLKERLDHGMIDEVKRLRKEGVSFKRLEGFGLEYRWCARFLQGNISREDLVTGLQSDIRHYAKRQLTFLRRLERSGFDIEWIDTVP